MSAPPQHNRILLWLVFAVLGFSIELWVGNDFEWEGNWMLLVLVLAILLSICLYVLYQRDSRGWPKERQWPGHGIDTQSIANRIDRLRHDYAPEARFRHGFAPGKRAVALDAARRLVGSLGYFRRALRHDDGDGAEGKEGR